MEQEPRQRNAENSDESAKDDSESSKKKKKRAKDLAELLAKKAESDETKSKPQAKEAEPSTWQKLMGEAQSDAEKKEQESGDEASQEVDEDENDEPDAAQQEIIRELESGEEAPELENLSQEEQAAVAKAYIEARLAELEENEDEPEDLAERTTLEEFLQNLRARINKPVTEKPDIGQAIEDSFAESVGPAPEFFGPNREAEAMADSPPEALPGPGSGDARPVRLPDERSEFLPDRPISIASAQHDSHYNFAPVGGKEEYISHDESMTREAQAQARGVAAGLLFGYLIGRRRGRIKTEKRMQKVQTKLEKQVKNVESQIASKEMQIKKLTQTNRETSQRLQTVEKTTQSARSRQPEAPPSAAVFSRQTQTERVVHATQPAEIKPTASPTAFQARERLQTPVSPEAKPAHYHNSSSRQEIIEKSSQIKIGESDLRKVWEARLIDEHGLRRIVAEAEAGGDVRRALASEFLARELRFERDPYLKDGRPRNPERSSAVKTNVADVMDALAVQHGNPTTSASGSANQTKHGQANSTSRQPVKVSPVLLTGLTILTISLAIWAIYLMITA